MKRLRSRLTSVLLGFWKRREKRRRADGRYCMPVFEAAVSSKERIKPEFANLWLAINFEYGFQNSDYDSREAFAQAWVVFETVFLLKAAGVDPAEYAANQGPLPTAVALSQSLAANGIKTP